LAALGVSEHVGISDPYDLDLGNRGNDELGYPVTSADGVGVLAEVD
jgi:hypothetical protein